MTPFSPLHYLLDKARKARDHAGQALAADRRAVAQTASQLDVLLQYRAEYSARLQDALHRGTDTLALDNYRRFIQSLDTAITQARQALATQQGRVSTSQQQWQSQQRTLSSYDTLISRRSRQAQQQADRQTRRQDDELSAGLLARRRQDNSTTD